VQVRAIPKSLGVLSDTAFILIVGVSARLSAALLYIKTAR
jgi:hypothetical protein